LNNKFLIAVDSGKSTTKAIFREGGVLHKVKFQTKMEEVVDIGAEITPGSFTVEFEDKSYLVGDMLDESKMDFHLSKRSETHRISILLAIAQLLQKSKQNIVLANITLAVNIPISLYKNERQKNEFSEFIQNKGETISMIINKKPYLFRIGSILLLPEGIGPIYSDINQFRGKRVLIFDLGSLNVNIQEYNNLIPVYEKMAMADLGVNILRSKIADNLSTRYGISITDSDVEAVYRDKYLYLNGEKQQESKGIVETLITAHVKEIFNFARSRKLTFNNTEVIFVGGGSLLLRDFIMAEYPSATIPTDPQWANVLSFLRILEAKQHGQTA
jgi:plasmid segregation protein ParM